MSEWLIPSLLTCGPLAVAVLCWCRLSWTRKWPQTMGLAALSIVSVNAAFAAWNFLYYHLRPTPDLPPWKDPQVLNFGLLFLTVPFGMIVGFIAGLRGTPWWLVGVMLAASLPLLVFGLLAGVSV